MPRAKLKQWALSALWFAGCLGLVIGGTGLLHWRSAATHAADQTAPAMPVRLAEPDRAAGVTETVQLAGRVAPARQTLLAFERAGTVTEVLVDEGDVVTAGTELARLDTRLLEAEQRRLEAERAATAADRGLAERTENRRSELERQGYTATQLLDEARFSRKALEARLAALDASLAAIAVDLEKSVLTAPFAGTIGRRDVDDGAVVAPGTPALELLETGVPEARIGIPGSLLAALRDQETYTVDLDGHPLTARLKSIRPDRDPVTNTQLAMFAIESDGAPLPMNALVTLALHRTIPGDGFWSPIAILEPAAKGLWHVPMASPRDGGDWLLDAVAVTILHVEAERAFVAGALPANGKLVIEGAHRVERGARVIPASES